MKRKNTKNTTRINIKTIKETTDIDVDKISYKHHEYLMKFITDRGKIMGKERTGLSSADQRKLTKEVKRARHLGLLPFVASI